MQLVNYFKGSGERSCKISSFNPCSFFFIRSRAVSSVRLPFASNFSAAFATSTSGFKQASCPNKEILHKRSFAFGLFPTYLVLHPLLQLAFVVMVNPVREMPNLLHSLIRPESNSYTQVKQ